MKQKLLDQLAIGAFVVALGIFAYTQLRARSPVQRPGLQLVDSLMDWEVVGQSAQGAVRWPSRNSPLTLFYVFRTDCPACARQAPEWRSLAEGADSSHVPVFGLSYETDTVLVQHYFDGAKVATLGSVPPQVLSELGVNAFPTTALVDSAGRIVFWARGVMDDAKLHELRAALR